MPEASICNAGRDYIVDWGGRGWVRSRFRLLPGSTRTGFNGWSLAPLAPPRALSMPHHDPTPSSSAEPPGSTLIVGGDAETRLLVRGLLRLYHYRVEGDVPSADLLPPADANGEGRVLILVVDTDEGEWTRDLATARAHLPGVRPMLVVSELSPSLEARARAAGVRAILPRPFAIRDLISTVQAVGRGEERFGTPAPPR